VSIRAIEQSRDHAGYMVWPAEIEERVNAAADQVTGLCWTAVEVPHTATWLSCLLPMDHDGECGWDRALEVRLGGLTA
jgi:hypothetical protein